MANIPNYLYEGARDQPEGVPVDPLENTGYAVVGLDSETILEVLRFIEETRGKQMEIEEVTDLLRNHPGGERLFG